MAHSLVNFLKENLKSNCWNELWQSVEQLEQDPNELKFNILFSTIGKKFRIETFSWNKEQIEFLDSFSVKLSRLNSIKIARVAILIHAQRKWIKEIILRGDDSEQSICLYALSLLENNEQYHKLAVNSCRTNSENVFSALAHNNPYAKKVFEDKEFYQMALKTIFMGLDFSKIVGLNERYTNFFGTQLLNFYKERKAAGRTLPDNVIEFMRQHQIIN